MTAAATAQRPATTTLLSVDPDRLCADFDRRPFQIHHRLCDHPLFALPRLVELARRLPATQVEYNAGNLPLTQDPTRTPQNGLSVEETIQRIENCQSWLVLKFVETDPEYRQLLDQCLEEIAAAGQRLGLTMSQREAFIFVSSPGSVTPYHIDPECNFLLQIRGTKIVHQFDAADRSVISEPELESFFCGGHRNLIFKDEYQAKARTFVLRPGMGLHFPVAAPHWVKNGADVSISFSITFRTPASERRSVVHQVNARLRRWGLRPTPVGQSAWRDFLKHQGFRVVRRARRLLGLSR